MLLPWSVDGTTQQRYWHSKKKLKGRDSEENLKLLFQESVFPKQSGRK